jgi:hypothetical protein
MLTQRKANTSPTMPSATATSQSTILVSILLFIVVLSGLEMYAYFLPFDFENLH